MIYTIEVPERHTARYVVEADSEADARTAAGRGDFIDVLDLEFVETVGPPDEWDIVNVEDA